MNTLNVCGVWRQMRHVWAHFCAERRQVQAVVWLCLGYLRDSVLVPGQLTGDLNMLQHIHMDPQATLAIPLGPSPVNLITRLTVRVGATICSIYCGSKCGCSLWSQFPSCHVCNDNIMITSLLQCVDTAFLEMIGPYSIVFLLWFKSMFHCFLLL